MDNLELESPSRKALERLPFSPAVPYHSVRGVLVPHAPRTLWIDGVVSYESAHLHGARSELVVKNNYSSNDHPRTIAEVHRIPRLHIGETMARADHASHARDASGTILR